MTLRLSTLALVLLAVANTVTAAEESRFYDPVSGKMISSAERQAQAARELLFKTTVDEFELGDILVKELNGTLWVELQDLINLLDFPIQLQNMASAEHSETPVIQADGWFIQEDNRFTINPEQNAPQTYTVTQKKGQSTFTADEIKMWDKRIYVPLQLALGWFEINYQADSSALTLKLKPKTRLPVQERKLRQSRQSSALVSQLDIRNPRNDVPYQAFAPAFADVQLNAAQDYQNQRRYTASILGTGDLAYMTGRYFFSYSYNEATDIETNNFRLALERNSLTADLLGPLAATHVSVGDISTTPIINLPSGSNDVGMRFSNRPYGRITNASTQTISGFQQPGWDVELYLNDIFIGSQTIGDDGRYQFLDQALSVGENRFTLRFYGPQGQREEAEQLYQLDPTALVGGKLIYDVSLSRQDWQLSDYFDSDKADAEQKLRFNLHLEKGLGQQVSLTGDYSRYQFIDGVDHQFIQPGIRFFLAEALFNLTYLQDLDAGNAFNFSASRGFGQAKAHRLNYSYGQQSEDFRLEAVDPIGVKQTHNLSLQGPLFVDKGARWQYLLGAVNTQYYDDSSQESYRFNLGTNLGRFSLTHNLDYTLNHPTGSATNKTLKGNLQLRTGFDRFYVRSGFGYSIEPEQQADSANLDLLWNIAPDLNTEWAYDYNFTTEQLMQSYALNWGTKHFTTSFKVNLVDDMVSGQLNFRFSLGHDPMNHELMMSAKRLSNSGAVSALVFEDLNNNQQLDANEPRIENAEVIAVQQRRRAKTDAKGTTMLTGLYDTQPTDIEVNPNSLADPFWMPSQDGISFLPRPGLVKTVLIPIVTAGEIEGSVSYAPNLFNKAMEQGRVPLLLTNLQNGKNYTRETAFDGFYLFEKIPPGKYQLDIQPAFLQQKGLKTRNPIGIEVGANGTLIMGANFELYPQDKYQYATKPVTDTLYTIDLGTFISENNAKVVINALRQVFPELLGKTNHDAPYELLLTKTPKQKYQVLLGPVTNLNYAKFLCGSLAKENLHCQVQKQAQQITAEQAAAAPISNATLPVTSPTPVQTGFTIQLMTLSDEANALAIVRQYQDQDVRLISKTLNGQTVYTLVSGAYPSKDAAQADAQLWKTRLGITPWIRAL
jgi:hypothetical protein